MICEFTGRELNLADCVVYLPTGAGGLVQSAAWGPKRGADRMLESRIHLSLDKGIAGACARKLQLLRVDDTRGDARYLNYIEPGLSELAAPICVDEVLLGVLDSEHATEGFYDDRYEQAFAAIADRSAAHLWRLRALTA